MCVAGQLPTPLEVHHLLSISQPRVWPLSLTVSENRQCQFLRALLDLGMLIHINNIHRRLKYRIQNANAVIYREKCKFAAPQQHSLPVEKHPGKPSCQKVACENEIRTRRVGWINHMCNGIRLWWSDGSVWTWEKWAHLHHCVFLRHFVSQSELKAYWECIFSFLSCSWLTDSFSDGLILSGDMWFLSIS